MPDRKIAVTDKMVNAALAKADEYNGVLINRPVTRAVLAAALDAAPTAEPFTEVAHAESVAQEPTNGECVALLRVMYPDIPFNSPSHYPDAMARARAALSDARATRRDEGTRGAAGG